MRKKTKQILLAHFGGEINPDLNTRRTYKFLYDLFPELSPEGVRTVMNQLVQKKYLSRYQSEGKSVFELTQSGIQLILQSYPALKVKNRKTSTTAFHLCIFLEPPQQDQGFRRLRKKLLQQRALQLVRGTYLLPYLSDTHPLRDMLLSNYSSSIVLIECAEFSLGSPDQINSYKQDTEKRQKTLSGISEELNRLLKNTEQKKDSSFKTKAKITSFFYSLLKELESDEVFFPGERKSGQQYLQAFKLWSQLITEVYFSR